MSKKALYITFTLLTIVVISTLVISFKYIKIATPSQNITINSDFADTTVISSHIEGIEDSWLAKIDQEENGGKPYFFAINEIEIALN